MLDLGLISPTDALRMSADELGYWAERIGKRPKPRRPAAVQPVVIVKPW